MAPFLIMDLFEDVDDKLYTFEKLYHDILDEHAPLKYLHIRGKQVPYMTDEWRKAIRHRNKLWKIFTREMKMKIMKNINVSVICALPFDAKP